MTPRAKVRLNMDGLSALTAPVIQAKVEAAAAMAGEGFVGDVIRTDRPHGAVRAATREAAKANARDNRLLKAVLAS